MNEVLRNMIEDALKASIPTVSNRPGEGLHGMSKDEWDAVIAVNLTGPFLAAREFAACAIGKEKDGAVMVNISSSARNGYIFQSNYRLVDPDLGCPAKQLPRALQPRGDAPSGAERLPSIPPCLPLDRSGLHPTCRS